MKYLHEYLDDLKDEKINGIVFIDGFGKQKSINYSEFRLHSLALLTWLRENGVAKDDYLIIKVLDKEIYLNAIWACIYGGIKCICTALDKIDIDKKLLCSSSVHMLVDQPFPLDDNKIIKTDYNIFNHIDEKYICHERKSDDVLFIQYSSGSTSEPKGIMLTEENILTHSLGIEKHYGLTNNDSFISWLPLNHNMGLAGFHITPLLFNISQIQIDTLYFRKNPKIWFDLIENHNVTVAVSNCSVLGLMSIMSVRLPKYDWNLKSLRVIFVAGEKVDVQTYSMFLEQFNSKGLTDKMITPSYGLTESTLTVSAKLEEESATRLAVSNTQFNIEDKIHLSDNKNSNIIISVGKALPHIELKITNLDDLVLNEGLIGIVKVKSKANAKSYLKISNNILEGHEINSKNGFIDTGDIGFLLDNELYIIGRYKEMISLNGKNYFYNDIEEKIKEIYPELNQKLVVATITEKSGKEKLGIFINDESITETTLSELKKKIEKELGIDIEKCIKVTSFPLTTLGKVSRYQITLNYANGLYNVRESVDQQNSKLIIKNKKDIEKLIIQTCDELLNININVDDSMIEVCKNSMTLTIVLKEIANQFDEAGIKISKDLCIAHISNYPTVSELSAYLFEQIEIKE